MRREVVAVLGAGMTGHGVAEVASKGFLGAQ